MKNLQKFGVKKILFIDFESYYSTSLKYDLKSISMTEYIRDSLFRVQGLGWSDGDECGGWVSEKNIVEFLTKQDWINTTVCAHNVKFDGAILKWIYNINPKLWIDTKGMARAVIGPKLKSFSLKSLAEYYQLPAKGELKTDGLLELTEKQEKELAEYCLHDVQLCAEIFRRLQRDFPEDQYPILDWTIRAFTEPKLVVDIPKLTEMVKNEKKQREETINKSGISKDDLSSNTKFADVLKQNGIKIPTKRSIRTGRTIPALSLGDEGFLALKNKNPELYAARTAAKSTIYETRGLKYLNVGKTGPLPFDVEFSGALQTHRFSGGNGAGGNPQNIPKDSDFRDAIQAPDGYALIVGDYSQIELRILAYLSGEPKLIKSLNNNEDVYSEFASRVYNKPITKDNEHERFVGKCAVLGLGYGMGAKRFKHQVKVQGGIDISQEGAEKVVNLYRTYYSMVPKLWNKMDVLIRFMAQKGIVGAITPFLSYEHGLIVLPSGLVLQYPNLRQWDNKYIYDIRKKVSEIEYTELYGGKLTENICQALAGEICKDGIQRAQSKGLDVVGAVHDEVLIVDKEDNSHILKEIMEKSPIWWPEIHLSASVGIGKSWAEAKQ